MPCLLQQLKKNHKISKAYLEHFKLKSYLFTNCENLEILPFKCISWYLFIYSSILLLNAVFFKSGFGCALLGNPLPILY